MTPNQISLVQESFKLVKPISEQAAELFYNRLFEIDPSLRPLFKGDIKAQGRKLMATLSTAVNALNDPQRLLPAISELSKRHVSYGVKSEHFKTVGDALLWTLEKGLGSAYTPEVKDAWTEVYVFLSSYMLRAWQDVPAPAPAASAPAPAKKSFFARFLGMLGLSH